LAEFGRIYASIVSIFIFFAARPEMAGFVRVPGNFAAVLHASSLSAAIDSEFPSHNVDRCPASAPYCSAIEKWIYSAGG
jgi:hypothetical protein